MNESSTNLNLESSILKNDILLKKVQRKKLKVQAKLYSVSVLTTVFICISFMVFIALYTEQMHEFDGGMIIKIQNLFFKYFDSVFCRLLTRVFIGHIYMHILGLLFIIVYISVDPFYGYKCYFALNICVLVRILLVLFIYSDSRPYWDFQDIRVLNCYPSFTGPSSFQVYHFGICFYCIYLLYSNKICSNKTLIWISLFLILFGFIVFFFSIIGGILYLYQNILGIFWGITFAILLSILDTSISWTVIKIGFTIKSAMKWKILLFALACILAPIIFGFSFFSSENESRFSYQDFQIYQSKCSNSGFLLFNAYYNTASYLCYAFTIPAMSFGSSFAYYYLETYWFLTSLKNRILRGIIAATFYILLYVLCNLILFENPLSKVLFNLVLPLVLVTYTIFGLVPLLSKKLSLVNLQKISPPDLLINESVH